jgi:hypothetical protein
MLQVNEKLNNQKIMLDSKLDGYTLGDYKVNKVCSMAIIENESSALLNAVCISRK